MNFARQNQRSRFICLKSHCGFFQLGSSTYYPPPLCFHSLQSGNSLPTFYALFVSLLACQALRLFCWWVFSAGVVTTSSNWLLQLNPLLPRGTFSIFFNLTLSMPIFLKLLAFGEQTVLPHSCHLSTCAESAHNNKLTTKHPHSTGLYVFLQPKCSDVAQLFCAFHLIIYRWEKPRESSRISSSSHLLHISR